MQQHEILDEVPSEEVIDIDALLKAQKKKYFIIWAAITVCDIIVAYIVLPNDFQESTQKKVTMLLEAFILGYPMFGFFIALLANFIPYKGLPYWKKYVRTGLIASICFAIAMAALIILMPVRRALGF